MAFSISPRWRRRIILSIGLRIVLSGAVYFWQSQSISAQTSPLVNADTPMGQVIGLAVLAHMQASGFVVTDVATGVVIESTLEGIGVALAADVAAVEGTAVAVATAPAWLPVLVAASPLIATVAVGAAVGIGICAGLKWLKSGTSSASGPALVTYEEIPTTVTDLVPSFSSTSTALPSMYPQIDYSLVSPNDLGRIVRVASDSSFTCGGALPVAVSFYVVEFMTNGFPNSSFGSCSTGYMSFQVQPYGKSIMFVDPISGFEIRILCSVGNVVKGIQGTFFAMDQLPAAPVEEMANLSPTSRSTTVDPKLVADAINTAWKLASQLPGYKGAPYTDTVPVTTTEVKKAVDTVGPQVVGSLAQQPSSRSSTSPVDIGQSNKTATGGITSTKTGTGSGTGSGTGTNTSTSGNCDGTNNCNTTNNNIDIGTDPGTAFPSLTTHTGKEILGPLSDLLPDLAKFKMPSHTSTCPTMTFDVFNKHILVDQQCKIAEQLRPTLSVIFLLGWGVLALLIILAA
jgi:hypothetical protein